MVWQGGAHVHVADGVRREVAGRALLALGVAGGGAGHLVGLATVDDRAAGAVGLEEALLAVAALLRDVLALGAVAADAVVVAAAVLAVLHLLALGARVGATAEVADVAGGADGVVGARALDVVTAGHGHEGDERRGQAAAAALDDGLGLDVGDHGGGALLVVAPEDLEAGALVLAAGLAAQAGLELLGAHDEERRLRGPRGPRRGARRRHGRRRRGRARRRGPPPPPDRVVRRPHGHGRQ